MSSPFFFRLFSVSPFKKICHHADKVSSAMVMISQLLAHSGNHLHRQDMHRSVCRLESGADRLKYEMRDMLHSAVFMPVSKPMFLEMLDSQDKIINQMKDISGLIYSRKMTVPDELIGVTKDMCAASLEACRLLEKMQGALPVLQESGFKGPILEKISLWQISIDEIESQVDLWHFNVRTQLYQYENDWPAVDMMFLYILYSQIASISDWVQRTAGRYMMMVAK